MSARPQKRGFDSCFGTEPYESRATPLPAATAGLLCAVTIVPARLFSAIRPGGGRMADVVEIYLPPPLLSAAALGPAALGEWFRPWLQTRHGRKSLSPGPRPRWSMPGATEYEIFSAGSRMGSGIMPGSQAAWRAAPDCFNPGRAQGMLYSSVGSGELVPAKRLVA